MGRLLAAALALLASAAPGTLAAQPTSPERQLAEQLARRLLDTPRGPDAPLLLEQVWQSWDQVGPDLVTETLERVAGSAAAEGSLRESARWHLAEAALRRGQPDEARHLAASEGVILHYLILGPLDNESHDGLDRRWPPEESLTAPLDVNQPVEGSEGPVTWRTIEIPGPLGELRLQGAFQPASGICAYALTTIELERPLQVVLHAGAEGALVLWINGREVVRDAAYRRLHPDRFALRATLPRGLNRVMAKVCGDDEVLPALLLRATSPSGAALGERFSSRWDAARPALAGDPRSRHLETPFTRLWRLASDNRGTPRDRARIARYLDLTGGDDPAGPRAPDLASGAADAVPVAEEPHVWLLAAELAPDRNQALLRLEALVEATPDDAIALTAMAQAVAEGPAPQRARSLLRRALTASPAAVDAAALDARLLDRLGLSLAGLHRLERAIELAGPVPRLLQAAAELAERAGRDDQRLQYLEALVELRADDTKARRSLVELARARGERDLALRHLELLDALGWEQLTDRVWCAEARESLGSPEAAESLRRVVAQAPDVHEGWAALARLLAGRGRNQEALEPLGRALELRPQDQGLLELHAHLLGLDPFEDAFIETPETFLARRGSGGGEHARWLLDLQVLKVHPSGLSSRFRQLAVEVLDEEGARSFRGQAIGFVPGEQQVTVRRARVIHPDGSTEEASGRFIQQVSDPGIRMYYDQRAEVIELPRLRPGDVVEYAFRVDDVAAANVLGHVFGELNLLGGDEPRRRLAFVLIRPYDLTIHSDMTGIPGLSPSQSCNPDEGLCTSIWEMSDLPGLPRERRRPPASELGPRLALSTFASWDEVGRWFWGLAQDQLVADDHLREVVRELTDGLTTDEERVRAVHAWAMDTTRYVALEFGIHGYQPYPVTQVVDRGFGDCKDKASLLVAMLNLAGVEASMVLIRTRGSGLLDGTLPSLAVFDHAIAYVPGLDLFIDGTAEQNGIHELPWMDQGAMALVISTDGSSRLVSTPVDDPSRNEERREITVEVAAEGAPVLRMLQQVRGHEASYLRYRYGAVALRQERLVEDLTLSWPGARLLGHRFEELADRARPVIFHAELEAPSAARRQGDRLSLELARPRLLARRWARRSDRRTPLDLGAPPHREVEIRRIEVPPGASVEPLPPPVRLRSPFGSLEITLERRDDLIEVRTELEIRVTRIEPADYDAFRRFCQTVDQALERRVAMSFQLGR